MINIKTGFNSDNGDFMASRQTMADIEVWNIGGTIGVWNIGGTMRVAVSDDPIYITKEQAVKFFNLTNKD